MLLTAMSFLSLVGARGAVDVGRLQLTLMGHVKKLIQALKYFIVMLSITQFF